MLTIPKSILIQKFFAGKNKTIRYYGENDFSVDNESATIISTEPFIVETNGQKVMFTNKLVEDIPADCQYVLKTRLKPRKSMLRTGNLECIEWLKHPNVTNDTPEEIVSSWKGKFLYKKEDHDNEIEGLRTPQLGAIYAFMSNAQEPKDRGIIVMPTGTGKTETMLSVLVANQCKKVLVTVPYDPLREQLANKFIKLGILPKFKIVSDDIMFPSVSVISNGIDDINDWKQVIANSNVVITTMNLLAGVSPEIRNLITDSFSNIFIDEAHHSEAHTWSNLIDCFDKRKVTLFTATPFRNDGRKLQGKFLYTFSLKSAQEQGYYKKIDFLPIREYDKKKADKAIAEKAVARLKADLEDGHNHILMARCSTKARAEEVYQYYTQYADYNPVVVHSQIANGSAIIKDIKELKHRIIVCVNMLGEGFDLPQMKIAAVHDERQSLPITLQFIGRFTRTSADDNLGNASLIVNLANPPIADQLRDLYSKDSDWNILLPQISDQATQEEVDFNQMLAEFNHLDNSVIPFHEIEPALSAVIYRIPKREWNPDNWKSVFSENDYDYIFGDCNHKNTLVITLGKTEKVEWGKFEEIQNVKWDVILLYWYVTPTYNHAYLNTSLDSYDSKKLIDAIFGEDCEKITGENLFRCFSGVSRLAVMNFGGRKARQGDISFKSYYGKDVQEGISLTEQGTLTKNNLFGNGYRNGKKTSIGCSIKGKVWSYMRGNLKVYVDWCKKIGKLIEDNNIDPNIVLQNTLKVVKIDTLPKVMPISVDWDSDIYQYPEQSYILTINGKEHPFFDVELRLTETNEIRDEIFFEIATEDTITKFKISYSTIEESGGHKCTYHVSKVTGPNIEFQCRSKRFVDICDYFNDGNNAPVVFFADGSQLFANNYVELHESSTPFLQDNLIPLDWTGVNLSKESQHVAPYEQDSIQYFFAQHIMNEFDVLYDDDNSGEMADLVGIKDEGTVIHLHLYHLKYAKDGIVSNNITNFYEVCGQAQKSLKWKERNRDVFNHLLARKEKTYAGRTGTRILHGTYDDLESFASAANWKKTIKLHIYIVQPALSKSNASEAIMQLLGCVADFMKDTGAVDLKVYCSE